MALRLLLVEDDPSVAVGLKWALELAGHSVTHSNLGRPAIGLIHGEQPDAVLIDIDLPDIDGVTLGRAVRDGWPDLPIVFVTGHDDFDGLSEAVRHHRSVCIQKPFSIEALEKVFRSLGMNVHASNHR